MQKAAMKIIYKLSSILTIMLDVVIGSFFAAILFITILQVILRYGFNESVLGANEAMEGLFIYTTAIGAANAVRRKQHISITFLVELLPSRMQKITDVLTHLFIIFLNIMMIYYSVAWIGKVGGNESPVIRIPEWTTQVSIPIGCGLVICYCLINILIIICGERALREDQTC